MTEYSDTEKKRIDELVSQWLQVDVNQESRDEITRLQQDNKYEVLDSKLSNRIAFGTAGLRSSMESGFAHMNDVTILQASQGLVKYILQDTNPGKLPSIVIGYDHRFHSQRFAEITASVALSQGLKVYYLGSVDNLSDETLLTSVTKSRGGDSRSNDRSYVHTPLVPFAIDHLGASAGVMVTASHNPAKDNGYKVYYGNGCQIIPPHDDGIADSIQQHLEPWLQSEVWDVVKQFETGISEGKLIAAKPKITDQYVQSVKKSLLVNNRVSYPFVYTPMHGVGLEVFEKIVNQFESGHQGQKVAMTVVKEQAVPDPAFTTVKFPNPEERGALDLAMATADKQGSKMVLATDPDADRFSVAIKTRSSNKWRQLTGNEIGFLFAMYVIDNVEPRESLSNTYLLNSTVSSQVLASMAHVEGFKFQDTLTGFKWIGNKAIDLKNEGYSVPFGYEEAIGYMFGVVNDKDGISAASVWLQLYEKWFSSGEIDAIDKLTEGYNKYGWYKEANGYYKLKDLKKTDEIFNKGIRGQFTGKHQPEAIGNDGEFRVIEWRDLTVGYESNKPNNKPVLPVDSRSQMITALLQPTDANVDANDQVRFTVRGSGTEPKLKVYIEGRSSHSEQKAHELAFACWRVLRDQWFKPEQNDLEEVI